MKDILKKEKLMGNWISLAKPLLEAKMTQLTDAYINYQAPNAIKSERITHTRYPFLYVSVKKGHLRFG